MTGHPNARGHSTYRQEIARLRRRVRLLEAQRDGVRAPMNGLQVPAPTPEREAVRTELEDREARLRALKG